jgi:uncharacterized protein
MKVKTPQSAIRFETEKGNRYVCARDRRQVLLCHPIMYHVITLHEQDADLDHWINGLPDSGIEIEKAGVFTKKEVEYYYHKYLFLREQGYFGRVDFDRDFGLHLEPERIRSSLANTRQVIFEVTDACNLRCEYCGYGKFYKDYGDRKNIKLDLQVAKRLLMFLEEEWHSNLNASVGNRIAIGFYGGEPLLNFPFIRKIVEEIKQFNIPNHRFVFTMTTNALLLEKYMDFLFENQFELLISLDGNRRNSSYRVLPDGREAYDRILKNVYALKAKYPDYFREKVNFNAVFHNRSSLAEIYPFFKKKFDKTPMIRELNASGIDPSREEEFWNTFASIHDDLRGFERPQPMIEDMFMDLPLIGSLSKFIHQYTDCSFSDYNEVMDTESDPRRFPTGTCIPFSRKIFLTVNNKILPCEKIGQQHSMGFVTPEKVNIDFDRIAAIYNGYYRKISRLCRHCYLADDCGKCMLHLDMAREKPECNNFMTLEHRKDRFSSHLCYLEENPRTYPRIIKEVAYD